MKIEDVRNRLGISYYFLNKTFVEKTSLVYLIMSLNLYYYSIWKGVFGKWKNRSLIAARIPCSFKNSIATNVQIFFTSNLINLHVI